MDTDTLPAFDINHARYVAARIESGRAHPDLVASSHEMLLSEVERLTFLVSPAKLKQPARGESVPVSNVLALIAALEKHPRTAAVRVEFEGVTSNPGDLHSYRGFYDQLAIERNGAEPVTVAGLLKELRTIRRKGIIGDGGPYPVQKHTGVWVSDYGQTSGQHLSGVRVDGGIVVIETEERDW